MTNRRVGAVYPIMIAVPRSRLQCMCKQIRLRARNMLYWITTFFPILIGLTPILTRWNEGLFKNILMGIGMGLLATYISKVRKVFKPKQVSNQIVKVFMEEIRIERVKRCMGTVDPPLSRREISEWELCPRSGSRALMCEQSKIKCDACKAELDVSTRRIPDHLLPQISVGMAKLKLPPETLALLVGSEIVTRTRNRHPKLPGRPVWGDLSGA